MYDNCTIYGPYEHTYTKRKFVEIHYPDGTRKHTNYARYLMECHLNRYLSKDEEVDHIDDDCTNDSLDNLQVLSSSGNREKNSTEMIEVECAYCGIPFDMPAKRYRFNQIKKGHAGPYCSKSCSGKVHH